MATLLGVAGIACVLSLLGLLVAGARWRRRTGPFAGMVYFASVVALVFVAAPLLVGARDTELLLACLAALSVMAATGRLRPDWNPAGQAFLASLALTCGAFVASAAAYAFSAPLSVLAQVASVGLVVLECFALVLLLVGTHEVLDVVTRVRWRRRTRGIDPGERLPFVSVQVATHNEPPELVIETLRSLCTLDYPSFEVLVLDNNTDDPELWRPLAGFCDEAGMRFVHLEDWPGFKAGALNHGLAICDERTEVIAVVDADFVVAPDFLRRTVGYFDDPRRGIVQTAQGFRGDGASRFLRRLALTYRSFDEVTMPSRNERDAIIFAGTMGLIRRSALIEAGGWGEWCVTEDAELSLRILSRGYSGVYVEHEFGRGVMPLTFAALKRQRFRWCLGGVQLLRRHWRLMITGRGSGEDGAPVRLTAGQRYEFLTSGLQWFQALLTVAFTLLLVLGVAGHALGTGLALRPLAGAFVAVPALLLGLGLIKSFWGLRARLRVGLADAAAVFVVFLGLTWAVALGCVQGLSGRRASFLRTPKFDEREALRHALRSSRAEALLAATCVAAAVLVLFTRQGSDAAFLAVLCGWSTAVFASGPVTAVWAVGADLTGALRRRRELETSSSRLLLVRRPARLSYAGVSVAAALLLIAPGLAFGPSSGGLAGVLRPAAPAGDDEPAGAAAPRRAAAARAIATPGAPAAGGEEAGRSAGSRSVSRRVPAASTPGRRRGADRRATPVPVRARPAPGRGSPGSTATPTPAATPQGARPTATPTPQGAAPTPQGAAPTAPPGAPTATPTPPPSSRPTATPTPPPVPRPTATPTPRR